MGSETIVAIIAFFGTLVGTGGGILVSSKLVNYRIEQLEKKVDKHNGLVERMYGLEKKHEACGVKFDNIDKCLQRILGN